MASTDKAEKANLRGVVKDLSTQVDALGELSLEAQRESLQYFTKFKEGFVESAGAISLYASTYVLYTYAGGDTWNKIKSGDQELDIKRVFPLSGYMLAQGRPSAGFRIISRSQRRTPMMLRKFWLV
jgi:hypothetical protein